MHSLTFVNTCFRMDNNGCVCVDCGKSYKTMKSLAVHRKSHTGLRPYSCHKSFVRKDIMQEHARGHDPTQPNYVCQECGMGFARRFSLQAHIFHHNPDNRFKCSLCQKSHLTRSNLRRHEETHAEKQTCPNCNAVVMHLKLHRKTCGTNETFLWKGV